MFNGQIENDCKTDLDIRTSTINMPGQPLITLSPGSEWTANNIPLGTQYLDLANVTFLSSLNHTRLTVDSCRPPVLSARGMLKLPSAATGTFQQSTIVNAGSDVLTYTFYINGQQEKQASLAPGQSVDINLPFKSGRTMQLGSQLIREFTFNTLAGVTLRVDYTRANVFGFDDPITPSQLTIPKSETSGVSTSTIIILVLLVLLLLWLWHKNRQPRVEAPVFSAF